MLVVSQLSYRLLSVVSQIVVVSNLVADVSEESGFDAEGSGFGDKRLGFGGEGSG